jgi:EAL domain-containing protein (putative c-di-GMP-specific phosphodiesterase class I)
LVQALDRRAALKAVRLLALPGTGPLEVNVAAKTIEDPEFADAVEEALREADADPRELIIEVREQMAVADLKRARAFSERARAMGCGFALDNFGSGFGSFFYLKHVPIDYVKIDGDLVRGIATSRVDREVVSSIVDVAAALGPKTVGERVNDERTLELLTDLGVDYAQGFHLGMPVPLESE